MFRHSSPRRGSSSSSLFTPTSVYSDAMLLFKRVEPNAGASIAKAALRREAQDSSASNGSGTSKRTLAVDLVCAAAAGASCDKENAVGTVLGGVNWSALRVKAVEAGGKVFEQGTSRAGRPRAASASRFHRSPLLGTAARTALACIVCEAIVCVCFIACLVTGRRCGSCRRALCGGVSVFALLLTFCVSSCCPPPPPSRLSSSRR